MQFKVPQFIDIEDKVFGPFTFKQFVYLVGGAGLCYVFLKLLPAILALPLALAVGSLSVLLTFYKVNGKPFEFTLRAWLSYISQKKLYIWQQEKPKPVAAATQAPRGAAVIPVKGPLSEDRLKDLAWSLDVLDANQGK